MYRAGLVGEDGATHNGIYDIAYLRCFPGIVLMSPMDGPELHEMMKLARTLNVPVGIRYPRGNAPEAYDLVGFDGNRQSVQLGKALVLRKGADGAVMSYGHMVKTALEAAELLAKQGINIEVVNARFCKPLDEDFVIDLCNRHDRVITLEDHAQVGGFGSTVLECVAQHGEVRATVQVMGVPDEIFEHMSRAQIIDHVGLTAKHVAQRFRVGRDVVVNT
jgi:1-deoxy-D-xylulose-5-phosphate synthase